MDYITTLSTNSLNSIDLLAKISREETAFDSYKSLDIFYISDIHLEWQISYNVCLPRIFYECGILNCWPL